MSFWGKTKATGYATTGIATAGIAGLLASNGAKKFGADETCAVLDGAARTLETVDAYVSGLEGSSEFDLDTIESYLTGDAVEENLDDPTELDYSEETWNNVTSGLTYGAIGAAGLYGASRLFRSAGQNW